MGHATCGTLLQQSSGPVMVGLNPGNRAIFQLRVTVLAERMMKTGSGIMTSEALGKIIITNDVANPRRMNDFLPESRLFKNGSP